MVQRKGKKKALLVIGHKILCAVYILLKTGLPYQEFGVERFEKQKERKESRILEAGIKRAWYSGITKIKPNDYWWY